MSNFIIKYFMNRILKDNQWNKFGVEDPYYEYLPIISKNGKTIKYQKIKRSIPPALSTNDEKILQNFKIKAYRYDYWFNLFGVSFGWTNIIGVIPFLGSFISTFWSLQLLLLARKLDDGFPLDLQCLFILNILIDFVLGLIPFIGSIIEVGYKANSRNYLLLEKHLIRISDKNRGLISKDEVRPNFINDKVQPYVEENLKPQAIEFGKTALKVGNEALELINRKRSSSTSSTASTATANFTTSARPTTTDDSTINTNPTSPAVDNISNLAAASSSSTNGATTTSTATPPVLSQSTSSKKKNKRKGSR
ncbi:unnamed protein product [Candida verbasci]|uniref:Uncharacterized protein n=1 Tax=Candida verbasci TaxID=1227364 RepID=A0A9W4TTZ8_9ASCO|nr:unnamed protein product [Candida verbasci]